jgi:DnaJ-class molecular chaperone
MIKRIFDVLKSNIEYQIRKRNPSLKHEEFTSNSKKETEYEDFSKSNYREPPPTAEQQIVDDLALFGLKLPSSLKEVKSARNREMLKYHPDKFASDNEKIKVANDIALIYNAAFDRLEKHFDTNKK